MSKQESLPPDFQKELEDLEVAASSLFNRIKDFRRKAGESKKTEGVSTPSSKKKGGLSNQELYELKHKLHKKFLKQTGQI